MIFSYDKKPFWQDLDVLHINRLPPRAFFVPYRDANKAISNALPQASDCVTMLDGEWEYKYFRSAMYIAEEDIYSSEGYAVTEIPSCWQAQGIEPPVYINVAFPIPADPPNVPYENPCVIYRKKFSVKREKNCIITFLGVSAAFSLYANGKFVGYSEGSHYVSEFDLSPFLKDGENTLAVLCYKWCNGSYFECQDMFRNNGIFRSVFLTHLPEAYLYDLLVKPVTDDKKRGRVYIKLNVRGTAEIKLTLTDCDGAEIASKHLTAEGGISRCFFTLDKPRLWSAEIPELYRLEVTVKSADGERTVRQPFGFKTVEVKKGVFLFNGKPIKLYGVNHHDTHPDRLSALNKEDMEKDVSLMKSLNINAVRFSHYPPHPYMLELCDKAGLYVVDEADAECHGELFMKEGKNYFSNDPAWKQTLAERADRLFERDKNHASVIMWSLGNESGAGANHIYAYKRLKRKIFNSLVHYEDTHTFPCDVSDVKSFMYSTPEDLSKIAKNSDKPIFLCEYAHCMGVGPGGLKEYLEFFDSEKKMMGGCIWEWAEHAVRQGGKLKYGGDNGEYIHDGNFCVDGMMSPDRELTPSAYEVKNAYRPIKAEIAGNAIRFRNRNLFVSSSIKAVFTLISDGNPVAVKEENFRFDAGRDKVIPLPFCGDGGECFINIDYYENESPIGSEQLFLSKKKYVSATTEKYKTEFTETDSEIAFFGKDVTVVFDKITNTVSSIKAFGSEFINQYPQINRYTAYSSYLKGFTYNLCRYGIDNDRYKFAEWQKNRLDDIWNNVLSREVIYGEDRITIKVASTVSAPKVSKLFTGETVYTLYAGGVSVKASIYPARDDIEDIPRFGMKFEMPPSFDTVEYYGYGDRENYPDFLESAKIGVYTNKVAELSYDYIKPQEGGERVGVRYFRMIDEKSGVSLKIISDSEPLAFYATSFDPKDFLTVKHNYELVKKNTTLVSVDGFYGGIGSNSCGPLPFERYRIKADGPKIFSFRIIPEKR